MSPVDPPDLTPRAALLILSPETLRERALGATGNRILLDTLRGGFIPAALGLGLGLLIAGALGGLVEPLLFDTSARDARVFGAVALILAAIALMATVIPAWRATRVDRLIALRAE